MSQFPVQHFGSTSPMQQQQQQGTADQQPGLVGHSAGHGQPQYLPEYLLGDATSVATSPVHSHRLWSSNLSDPYHHQSPMNVKSRLSSGSQSTTIRPNRSSIGGVDKHGAGGGVGPPTQGLFEGASGTTLTPNKSVSFLLNSTSGADVSSHANNRSSVSSMSPAQLDPFYTQGESLKVDDELDGTWVTVFGFPPSAVSFVLQQFSQYGNIIEHKMSGGDNWIHLHYGSRIQAKKALCKNGKIFCGNMMIGVTPCIHKDVMSESMKENVSTMARSPLTFSIRNREFSGSKTPNSFSGMRPLSQAYSAAAGEHAVTSGNCAPPKKGGVVNKAMEYVFGW